jgi:hypothetical protein
MHIVKYAHRHPRWYRRYSHRHRAGSGRPHVRKIAPIRRSPKYGRVRIEKRRDHSLPNHRPYAKKAQKTRRSIRAKPQPLMRHTATTKIAREGREKDAIRKATRPRQDQRPRATTRRASQKRVQSRTVQQKSPSKSVIRKDSRARSRAGRVRTQPIRQPNRIRGGRARDKGAGLK